MKKTVKLKKLDETNGKYLSVGFMSENKWGKLQIATSKSQLVALLAEVNKQSDAGKLYRDQAGNEKVYLSCFDWEEKQSNHDYQKSNGFQDQPLDDEIPF